MQVNSESNAGRMKPLSSQGPGGYQRVWRVVAVIAAIAFGAFGAAQFWPIMRSASRDTPDFTQQTVAPAPTGSLAAAPAAAPSVRAADPAIARLDNDDAGAKTPRTLVLIDTSPGQGPRDGTARLGTDPRNPQTYVVGALLLNGVRLTEVYRDYVVLERDRESTRLYVQGRATNGAAQNSPLTVVERAPSSLSTASSANAPAGDDPRTAAVTTYIRPNPVFDGEQLRGFAVYPGGQPAEFSKLGLQSGDVITAINSVGVADGEQIMGLLEQVIGGSAVDVTIQRSDEVRHIILDGSVIAAEHPEAVMRTQAAGAD